MELRFEQDPDKALINKKKHGVSFEEAVTAFTDPNGRRISDPDHSHQEDRFVLLGMTWTMRLLIVSHCFREGTNVVRVISARPATRRERGHYSARKS